VLGGSEPVTAAVVSGNYFQLLGVSAAFGRVFLREEDTPGAPLVAMLSYEFWERRFARDPGLLGRKLMLNGVDVAIVGIAPRGFGGTSLTVPDLWTPIALKARVMPQTDMLDDRDSCLLYGRLRPGVTPARAREELNALEAALPGDDLDRYAAGRPNGLVVGTVSRGGQPGDREIAGPAILLGSVGLVLLIACANVASLLLARSAVRQREIAIRLAIGASRRRLIRQLLTENAVLSLCAGAAGIIISWWTLRFLMVEMANSGFAGIATVALNITPDWRVLGYMLFLSMAATLGCGLAPALEASRPNLSPGLKDEGAAFGGRLRRSRLRDLMVGAQVTVCLVLLISAGLLAHASRRALTADLGFDYRNIVSLEVVFPPATSAAKIRATRVQLAQELERLPEIQSIAVASRLPLVHGGMHSFAVAVNGGPVDEPGTPDAWYTYVTPSYFATMGLPIVRGRNFTTEETRDGSNYDGSPVIISEATARKFWPGEDPIGKRLAFGPRVPLSDVSDDAHSVSSTVIGVARDVRSWRLERIDDTGLYLPVTNGFGGTASGNKGRAAGVIALRARGSEAGAVTAVRRLLQASHPELEAALGDSRTAFSTQNAFIASRLGGIGAAIVGILGLLMASVGIYGTVAFAVTERTAEIGIRVALGACRRDVLRLVLGETMRPVAAGLLLGFAGAAMASRVMHSILFGLGPLDPVAFLGVSGLLAAVALVAAYVPARRAMRVDPLTALRYE
jgi:putative ABC transport system permease protein